MRSTLELELAADHVRYEWVSLAQMAAELGLIRGSRTLLQNALLEAFLIHDRSLVNFSCGDYHGKHGGGDITPKDFLGEEWWPDDSVDRRLRGRLPVINKHLAHLTWERVTSDEPIMWQMRTLAHEVTYGMCLLVEAAAERMAPGREIFLDAREVALSTLPPLTGQPETVGPLAPPRK